jgi:hypothetical protein
MTWTGAPKAKTKGRVNPTNIDTAILATLRRLQELPCRCTIIASSGAYAVEQVIKVGDPETARHPWQAQVTVECQDGATRRGPIAHVHHVEVAS